MPLLQKTILPLDLHYLFLQCLQLLLTLLQLLRLPFQLNTQLLIGPLHFLNLLLEGQTVLLQYIIIIYALFSLVELQSSLQLVYHIILLGHLLGQHF